MSDDLDFDMEVVEEDELDELGAGGASSSEKDFSSKGVKEEEETAGENDSAKKVRKADELRSSNSVENSEPEAGNSKRTTGKHLTDPEATQLERDAFGKLPSDWEYVQTGESLEYIRSGISESQNQDGKGIPVTRIETIADGSVNYEKVGYVELNPEEANADQLKSGDLLFSNINSREQIGKTAFYGGEKPLYHGMNLLRLRYQKEVLQPLFAYYLYDSPMAKDIFFRLAQAAVGQSSINQGQLKNLSLPRPPLPEQRKIASVLYAVDQAIQKTEAIIEQAQRVKRGLMQDFFEAGYDNHCIVKERIGPRLRRVPASWDVAPIGDLADYQNGYGFSKDDWTEHGRPIIRIQDLTRPEESETNYFAGQIDSKYEVEEGDILVSWSATLGVFRWNRGDAVLNQHIFKVRNIRDIVDRTFLYYGLKYALDELERKLHGSTMKHVTRSAFENTEIPLPGLQEQRKIASVLDDLDSQIRAETNSRSQLNRLKKGLMQDLLTGEVRTADKAIEVLDEVKAHG